MNIFIITEGSSQIGYGHITRCTSICQAFEERGEMPVFVVNGDESVKRLFAGKRVEIFDWLQEPEKLEKIIKDADIVAVDSYLAGIGVYKKLCEGSSTLIFIDDYNRHDYPGGIVVNGTIFSETIPYKTLDHVKHLLGVKYMPLRREFWQRDEYIVKNNVENIMVTFGGDDLRDLTPKVLKILRDTYPNVRKTVIIGGGFKNQAQIHAAADNNTVIVEHLDAAGMMKHMSTADLAVSAGGQTLYELAVVGVPTISVQVADNQKYNVAGWSKAGFTRHAGGYEEAKLNENIVSALKYFEDEKTRKRSSDAGRTLCDGKGCERLIKQVLSYKMQQTIILRDIDLNDSKRVFDLANDELVRNCSYTSAKINWVDHQKWFEQKIKDKNCAFYAVEAEGCFAGQVRFDITPEERSAVVGVSMAGQIRGFGLSAYILDKAYDKFISSKGRSVDTVSAYIKSDNIASLKAFERARYVFAKDVVIKGVRSKHFLRKKV